MHIQTQNSELNIEWRISVDLANLKGGKIRAAEEEKLKSINSHLEKANL